MSATEELTGFRSDATATLLSRSWNTGRPPSSPSRGRGSLDEEDWAVVPRLVGRGAGARPKTSKTGQVFLQQTLVVEAHVNHLAVELQCLGTGSCDRCCGLESKQ